MSYIIIKHVKRTTGAVVPVVMLDTNHEVLEFSVREQAEQMTSLLQANTDSGHKYEIKEIKG
jgi:hypothetical protein